MIKTKRINPRIFERAIGKLRGDVNHTSECFPDGRATCCLVEEIVDPDNISDNWHPITEAYRKMFGPRHNDIANYNVNPGFWGIVYSGGMIDPAATLNFRYTLLAFAYTLAEAGDLVVED